MPVVVFVVVPYEFFGVVEGVDPRLPVIQAGWWDPFGVAVGVFAGGPAFFGESVVGSAGQGEVVDIGATGFGPAPDVVDLGVVERGGAARLGASAFLGAQHDSLRW